MVSGIIIEAPSYQALAVSSYSRQPVAGHPGCFVASTQAGVQLFVSGAVAQQHRNDTNYYSQLWETAFGKPVPQGYQATPLTTLPLDPLCVIAIIAILIGLLLPAVQKVRENSQQDGAGIKWVADPWHFPIHWH